MTYTLTDADVERATLIADDHNLQPFRFIKGVLREILTAHHADLERQGWQMVRAEEYKRLYAFYYPPSHIEAYNSKPPGGDK